MDYFKILNLVKEPFSNSPEPEFFYESPQHLECLQKLELAIRLRRGLNIVMGDVGTGKTTLCRQLIGRFAADDRIITHLLLDPQFTTPAEFLGTISKMFGLEDTLGVSDTVWQLKEGVKNYLFEQGVDEDRVVVLIIDEGQKIPEFCLEILREFLNYETNEYKLLQIVIFAQEEFNTTLRERSNFADRVNLLHHLGPLNFTETRSMIRFRMEKASEKGRSSVHFTYPALRAIHRATGGYPRKIVTLCHQIILAIIIQNRKKVNLSLVRSSAARGRLQGQRQKRVSWAWTAVLSCILAAVFVLGVGPNRVRQVLYSHVATLLVPTHAKQSIHVPAVTGRAADDMVQSETKVVRKGIVLETADTVHCEEGKETSDEPRVTVGEENGEGKEKALQEGVSVMSESPPLILGELVVENEWIVSRMVLSIRGACDPSYLRLVRKANPHIRNINHVEAGDIISFPAVRVRPAPLTSAVFVQLGDDQGTLTEAHRLLHAYAELVPRVKMIPYWHSGDRLKFMIVMGNSFTSKAEARASIAALPDGISQNATIVTEWREGTVFYAHF